MHCEATLGVLWPVRQHEPQSPPDVSDYLFPFSFKISCTVNGHSSVRHTTTSCDSPSRYKSFTVLWDCLYVQLSSGSRPRAPGTHDLQSTKDLPGVTFTRSIPQLTLHSLHSSSSCDSTPNSKSPRIRSSFPIPTISLLSRTTAVTL